MRITFTPGTMILSQLQLVLRLLSNTDCATKQPTRAMFHNARHSKIMRGSIKVLVIPGHTHLTHGAVITGHCFRTRWLTRFYPQPMASTTFNLALIEVGHPVELPAV